MGSQLFNWSTQYVIISWKMCRYLQIAMIATHGRKSVQCWRILKTKAYCYLRKQVIASSKFSLLNAFWKNASNFVSAGASRKICARVEKIKAQTVNLSLKNIVRCTWKRGVSMIASCGLTCNIPIRCYV
jgi:hypothetical protein